MAKRRVKRTTRKARPKAPTRKSTPRRKVRTKSALRVVKRPLKSRFRNRFAKFYWLHREDFNARRKRAYHTRKRSRHCVKCGARRMGKSIFCTKHLRLSRVYNRRSRSRR